MLIDFIMRMARFKCSATVVTHECSLSPYYCDVRCGHVGKAKYTLIHNTLRKLHVIWLAEERLVDVDAGLTESFVQLI